MAKIEYLMIHPDEDGNCVDFLTKKELEEHLNDAEGYGLTDAVFITDFDDDFPQEQVQCWHEDDVMIIKIEKIVVPKTITTKLSIE
jgi:hypothetical protein